MGRSDRASYYVIRVNTSSGVPMYLNFLAEYLKPNVISYRSSASRFESKRIAMICADYFVNKFWDSKKYTGCDVLYVMPKRGAPLLGQNKKLLSTSDSIVTSSLKPSDLQNQDEAAGTISL